MTKQIDRYLERMVKDDAADLFLTVGCPPSLRIENKIIQMQEPALDNPHILNFMQEILTPDQQQEFRDQLELNIAMALPNGERFRVNIFRQQCNVGMMIRRIKAKIPDTKSLKLPPIYANVAMEKRGLVLLVGAVGSGKSTSMAAMLGHRNQHGQGHILTVEDPIEFVHSHNKCLFTQREIGIDTHSYGLALKNALRQSPDVIVIGEIRDRATMENALLFCEAGSLCISTLHANNANQAIERIINFFPEEMHRQTIMTLSQNLRAIFSQRLVENVRGARSLALEVLLNEGLIRQLIAEGKIKEIKEVMEKNRDLGMQSFDQCLADMVEDGTITPEVALREADNPGNLRLKINQKRAMSGDFSFSGPSSVSGKKSKDF